MIAGMTPDAITTGRAEADGGQQQGDNQEFLFHNSDFKSVQKFLPVLER
jgi:hypothetical protein